MKKSFLPIVKLIAGTLVGYTLSHHISHPTGRARRHVPLVRLWRIQLTPNLMLATKNRTWHIHHWTYLPAFYIPLIVGLKPLLRRYWLHGAIAGAIIHGLTFGDRFTFQKK